MLATYGQEYGRNCRLDQNITLSIPSCFTLRCLECNIILLILLGVSKSSVPNSRKMKLAFIIFKNRVFGPPCSSLAQVFQPIMGWSLKLAFDALHEMDLMFISSGCFADRNWQNRIALLVRAIDRDRAVPSVLMLWLHQVMLLQFTYENICCNESLFRFSLVADNFKGQTNICDISCFNGRRSAYGFLILQARHWALYRFD